MGKTRIDMSLASTSTRPAGTHDRFENIERRSLSYVYKVFVHITLVLNGSII